jgi:hypothetical protein
MVLAQGKTNGSMTFTQEALASFTLVSGSCLHGLCCEASTVEAPLALGCLVPPLDELLTRLLSARLVYGADSD